MHSLNMSENLEQNSVFISFSYKIYSYVDIDHFIYLIFD